MADSEYAYTDLQVVARHDPDTHYETDANGMRQTMELPGFITVGVLIDGSFHPFARYHTTDVHEGIERASKSRQQSTDTGTTGTAAPAGSPTEPAPGQSPATP